MARIYHFSADYHFRMKQLLSVLTLLTLAVAAPGAANDYKAERFDARIEVLQGGSLRVTETIVFRFEEGTFSKVERVIPTRRTDGVEFVAASMDAAPFPQGEGAGHVNVRRKDRLRVEWLFSPQGPSVHTFVLTYVVRGVVRSENEEDVVAWRALPSEHKYAIDESHVELLLPVAPVGLPRVQTHRVGSVSPSSEQGRIIVDARSIERNGWLEVTARLAQGSAIATPPDWQRREQSWARYRNPALLAGAVVLFMGAVLLFGLRQSYDAPPRDVPASSAFSGPPDDAPPGLAGALAANGSPSGAHAIATLFWLAQRGVISVQEERVWGTRSFRLRREGTRHILAPHEQALLDTVFRGTAGSDGVTMSKAHSHITLRSAKFREAVLSELSAAGLIDGGRQQVRRNYNVTGGAVLALGLVALVPVGLLLQRFGPWFFAIPAALLTVAIASFIAAGAHTPLSNEGVRRAAAWRAYKKFLKELSGASHHLHASQAGAQSSVALLPYAVALGAGMNWAKLFKQRGLELPVWFRAASAADAHRSFVAFVGAGAATGHGGGGGVGGGGGAAGGGSSGAS